MPGTCDSCGENATELLSVGTVVDYAFRPDYRFCRSCYDRYEGRHDELHPKAVAEQRAPAAHLASRLAGGRPGVNPSGAGAPAESNGMEEARAPEAPERLLARLNDPALRPVAEKGARGREALVRGRPRPLPDARPPRRRRPREPRARAPPRQRRLLQRQPLPQPDEPLLGRLRPLRLGPQAGSRGRLHDGDRGSGPRGGGRLARRHHRAARRGRPPPLAPLRLLHRPSPHAPRPLPRRPHQGVDDGRARLDRARRQEGPPRDDPRAEGRRDGLLPRRRGGDLREEGPRRHLHEQDRRRDGGSRSPASATSTA